MLTLKKATKRQCILTVAEFTELRRNLKDANGEVKIYKNTLVKRALNDLSINIEDSFLEGPNAIVFGESLLEPIKVLSKFAKEHEKATIRVGIISGNVASLETTMHINNVFKLQPLLSKRIVFSFLQILYKKAFQSGKDKDFTL